MKISLCMIVRDEEEVLARCLESAAPLVDELVIVDTGSVDKTTEISHTFTKNVYIFPWVNDFSAARNFAFSKATGDYLLWLDADDVLPEESRAKFPLLRQLLALRAPDMVMCPYVVGTDEGGGEVFFYRERFLRRESGPVWQGRVHECIPPRGQVLRVPECRVLHLGSGKPRGTRNLGILLSLAADAPLGAREKFYLGRELLEHGRFREAISVTEELLGGEGWYVHKIAACRTLSAAHEALGEREAAHACLLRSFLYGEPRAGVLCELGRLLCAAGRLREAAFWYEAALACRDHSEEGDLELPACRGLTPLLGLVYCYYRLGDAENAYRMHKKTEELAPGHPSVQYNRRFFLQK